VGGGAHPRDKKKKSTYSDNKSKRGKKKVGNMDKSRVKSVYPTQNQHHKKKNTNPKKHCTVHGKGERASGIMKGWGSNRDSG